MNKKNNYNEDNIFAKILNKEAKAEVVLENEHVLCILDKYPRLPVHILVLPKGKFTDINDFSINSNSAQRAAIFDAFKLLIKKYKLEPNGCRIITNYGPNGRQEGPHLHFHLVGGSDVGNMLN